MGQEGGSEDGGSWRQGNGITVFECFKLMVKDVVGSIDLDQGGRDDLFLGFEGNADNNTRILDNN